MEEDWSVTKAGGSKNVGKGKHQEQSRRNDEARHRSSKNDNSHAGKKRENDGSSSSITHPRRWKKLPNDMQPQNVNGHSNFNNNNGNKRHQFYQSQTDGMSGGASFGRAGMYTMENQDAGGYYVGPPADWTAPFSNNGYNMNYHQMGNQTGPDWWSWNGNQFHPVDNGWSRRSYKGKEKSKEMKKKVAKEASEEEDADARERRIERLKRRRRSAGLGSESDEGKKDEKKTSRLDIGSPKLGRDERRARNDDDHNDRYKDRNWRNTGSKDAQSTRESEGRRQSPFIKEEKDLSRQYWSKSRDRESHSKSNDSHGRGAANEKGLEERSSRETKPSDSHYDRKRQGRRDEGRNDQSRTRVQSKDRSNHSKREMRSSRSPSPSRRTVDKYNRRSSFEQRSRDNGWTQRESESESKRDQFSVYYGSRFSDERRNHDEFRHSEVINDQANDKQRDGHSNSTEKQLLEKGRPSDAMQAAMEAALEKIAPAVQQIDTHQGSDQLTLSKDFEELLERPPPLIIRARPDEVYEQISQVGEGTYGQVFKAKSDRTGIIVALKKIRMESEKDGFPITAMREIKLLQGLRHDNVVRLHEMLLSKNSVYMVFEYLEHDLNGILSQGSIQFGSSHLKSLGQQLLMGLAYLHRHCILHRDLKCSNLLLNSEGTLKLADFGLARRYTKNSKANVDYTNRVVTLWYRPPELLFGETCYNDAIDVWGAGCIFLELFLRKPIFQGNDEIHQVQVLLEMLGPITKKDWPDVETLPWYDLVRPSINTEESYKVKRDASSLHSLLGEKLPADALDVAAALLRYDPSRRVSASGALRMDYFSRNLPRAAKPGLILSNVEGEWHEFESRQAKKFQPRTLEDRRINSNPTQQVDSPMVTQKAGMGPPQSRTSPNLARTALD